MDFSKAKERGGEGQGMPELCLSWLGRLESLQWYLYFGLSWTLSEMSRCVCKCPPWEKFHHTAAYDPSTQEVEAGGS